MTKSGTHQCPLILTQNQLNNQATFWPAFNTLLPNLLYNLWQTSDQLLIDFWSNFDRFLAYLRHPSGHPSTSFWPTFVTVLADLLAKLWQIFGLSSGQPLISIWPTFWSSFCALCPAFNNCFQPTLPLTIYCFYCCCYCCYYSIIVIIV